MEAMSEVTSVTTMYSCLNCHEMNQAKTRLRRLPQILNGRRVFSSGGIMAKPIELEINGKRYPVSYPAETPLLYVLRDELGLTGSKYGCGEGQCGACTVLIGGMPRRSCQIPVSAAAAKPINNH